MMTGAIIELRLAVIVRYIDRFASINLLNKFSQLERA